MRTCYQTLRHELKSVVVLAPQAEERRGKYTWRTIFFFPASFAAAPVLLLCLDYFEPQAEERRGETPESISELVPEAQVRDVGLDAKPRTTS